MMDCKLEHTSITLLRIGVIEVQGIVRNIFLIPVVILMMVYTPFLLTWTRFKSEKDHLSWYKALLFIPYWLFISMLIDLTIPFRFVFDAIKSLFTIALFEWKTRWAASNPKKPNGDPIGLSERIDKKQLEDAVMDSVMNDYGDGQ